MLRIVNWIAVILIATALVLGGFYGRQLMQMQILSLTEQQHINFAQGFENAVWKKHKHSLIPLFAGDAAALSGNQEVTEFAGEAIAYFDNTTPLRVNLYSANHVLLMTINGKQGAFLGLNATLDKANLDKSFSGQQLSSTLLENIPTQTGVHGIVLTVVPLKPANGKVELLLEFTSDVDVPLTKAMELQLHIAIGITVAIILLLVLSRFNNKQTEDIIAKQYEENMDLAAQAAVAKEQNQQKSVFLANITHELRTPLNAIIGFSEILKNEFVPAPGQTIHSNFIGDIHSSGVHLLSLINDILDYSKAEANKLELEVSEVNAIKMIQNCIRLILPRAELAKVKVTEELPKDQMTMITDSKKFKQILLNLLSNAVKFTPSDGIVKVSAWLEINTDMCVFEVKDSGIGIAPKDISRAMSPFGQVDNTLSRKFEGTGLGLPLTKKFVELMGGKFAIESVVNKGTTVTFSLPRELKEQEGVAVKQSA